MHYRYGLENVALGFMVRDSKGALIGELNTYCRAVLLNVARLLSVGGGSLSSTRRGYGRLGRLHRAQAVDHGQCALKSMDAVQSIVALDRAWEHVVR